MAGLGLMNRRRAIASSPVLSELNRYSYIRDSLLFELDGIDKGDSGDWMDLKGGITFINYGAEELLNGFSFNGASSYLMAQDADGWVYSPNRTMEIVFRCESEPEATSVLFTSDIATLGTFGFAIFPSSKIVAIATGIGGSNYPTYSYKNMLGNNYFAISKGLAILNSTQLSASTNSFIASANDNIYIGRRSSGNYFKGTIHAIRIHDRALTSEELEFNRQIDIKRFKL